MLRVDRMGFNRNFCGSQAGSTLLANSNSLTGIPWFPSLGKDYACSGSAGKFNNFLECSS